MSIQPEDFLELKQTVKKHADDIADLKTKNAVNVVQNKSIIDRLDKIDSHVSKIVWLVVVAILSGLASNLEWGWKIAG